MLALSALRESRQLLPSCGSCSPILLGATVLTPPWQDEMLGKGPYLSLSTYNPSRGSLMGKTACLFLNKVGTKMPVSWSKGRTGSSSGTEVALFWSLSPKLAGVLKVRWESYRQAEQTVGIAKPPQPVH